MQAFFVKASLVVGCVTVASPAMAACDMRYSTKLAEAALTASARISSNSLRSIADTVESALGDRSSTTLRLDARYAVFAAGGLAQEAYSETVSSYFCSLYERFANQPQKLAKLRAAEFQLRLLLNGYFDIGLWQVEAVEAREAKRGELSALAEAQPGSPILTRAEIDANLPSPNFDTTTLRQLSGNVVIPGALNIEACGGFVNRSIRRVEPALLSSLALVRPMLIKWLSGDEIGAKIDLWEFASSQMTNQLARINATEQLAVTPPFLACVQRAEAAAIKAEAEHAPPAQTPGTTTTEDGSRGMPSGSTRLVGAAQ